MTETVVHVTTLEQWKSVLDVWFEQGYEWFSSGCTYAEKTFEQYGASQLGLVDDGNKYICCWVNNDYDGDNLIEYSEFMAQQKEDNKMETYYVTKEQLDLIEEVKRKSEPLRAILTGFSGGWGKLKEIPEDLQKQTLRYLGGDETIKFKVKEQLYRLWRDEMDNVIVYMTLNNFGTPDWTMGKEIAFTAPLEEIKKWQTPAWKIEKVDD